MKLKNLFSRRVTSLLLVFLLAFSMLSTGALAAEAVEDIHVHTEDCTHEQGDDAVDEPLAASNEASPEVISGRIGSSDICWTFDADSGKLYISGSGECDVFSSHKDQPWAAFRKQITEVWFMDMESVAISNLAYWFDGCLFLTMAEIPFTTPIIGTRAFANCPSLRTVLLYHDGGFKIAENAFAVEKLTPLEIRYIPASTKTAEILAGYDWNAGNRSVYYEDVYGVSLLATGHCAGCGGTYSYTVGYDPWTEEIHNIRHWCSNCGYDQNGGFLSGDHTYDSSGNCTLCGYYNSSYDATVCYHTSTRRTWFGCEWEEYCLSCGELVDSGVSHGYTYTEWSGCNWYDYCEDCGNMVNSGTSHGSYSYGAWEYYSTTRHRRYYSCDDCGQGSYSYESHSRTTMYKEYSDTQHQYGSYCSTCNSYIGSTYYRNHTYSYGSWTSYSADQHRRAKSCTLCSYSVYEYEGHLDSDENGYCDACSHLMTFFSVTVPANMSLIAANDGNVYSATKAAVINNSSHAVEITSVTVTAGSGWTIVPYDYNMADAKVDSQLIGFYLNDAETSVIGANETLSLPTRWTIDRGVSFPLKYDAVVSATSEVLHYEQVLTVVFVIDWASR